MWPEFYREATRSAHISQSEAGATTDINQWGEQIILLHSTIASPTLTFPLTSIRSTWFLNGTRPLLGKPQLPIYSNEIIVWTIICLPTASFIPLLYHFSVSVPFNQWTKCFLVHFLVFFRTRILDTRFSLLWSYSNMHRSRYVMAVHIIKYVLRL